MNKKILINVIVPKFELEYDIYIPNNKKIGTIKKYILSSIKELLRDSSLNIIDDVIFIDRETGIEFQNDTYVKDSGIKNGTSIVVVWLRKEDKYGY